MQKLPFRSSRVSLFHHMIKDLGTFYDTDLEDNHGFLQGKGLLMAIPMIPDVDILCKQPQPQQFKL